MTAIAIAVPLKPGKSDLWTQRTQEIITERRREVESDWKRFGIQRSASWLQRTPHGGLAILYWEVDDPELLQERSRIIMTSDDDYYVTLRESLSDIFDFDRANSRPSSECVLDFRIE